MAFKSANMYNFCQQYGIELTHFTCYYPQGNGLAKSSNKILVRIIKKMLPENKRNWDTQLIHALWEDRVSGKNSIGMTPFQLVYGTNVVIPLQLYLLVMKFLQDEVDHENPVQRRVLQLIEAHQIRESLLEKV